MRRFGHDRLACGLSVCQLVCPGWVGCFALLIRAGAAALCARTRGEPSSARCEQRLSERLTPCPCEPVYACTGMRGQKLQPAFLSAYPHAAQRAVPGWRGGLGRVGADLASAGSMRPPPSPARHVSTARLATTHVRRETAHHHKSQARNSTLQQHSAARHHTRQARNSSPQRQPQNTCLVKKRMADNPRP